MIIRHPAIFLVFYVSELKIHKPDPLDRVRMSATMPIQLERGIGILLMVCRHVGQTIQSESGT